MDPHRLEAFRPCGVVFKFFFVNAYNHHHVLGGQPDLVVYTHIVILYILYAQ